MRANSVKPGQPFEINSQFGMDESREWFSSSRCTLTLDVKKDEEIFVDYGEMYSWE